MVANGWVKEGFLQRFAQKSTVIVFETFDPQRVRELKFAVLRKSFRFEGKEKKFDAVYYYEPWKGLQQLSLEVKESGEEVVAETPVTGPTGEIKRLDTALMHVDKRLRENFTCFIIDGLFKQSDALTAAVRSWTADERIYESQSVVFIIAESASQLFDQTTLRFVERVEVPLSTEEERKEILTRISREALGRKTVKPEVVRAAAGLNLHQVESAALESIFRHQKITVDTISAIKTKMIRDSGVLEPVEVSRGFSAWGGYDAVKQYIREAFIEPLSVKRKLAEQLGMELPRGLLFLGPPGTGKTVAMEAIASELRLPVFRLGSVFSKWVGESERNIKLAIKIAEAAAPAILYIDEIDRYGRARSQGDHEVTRRVFSELLEWLGSRSRKTIVIGATNVPEELDPAFVRPGRLDIKIPVLYPDKKAREEILSVHTSVVRNVPLKDVDLAKIAAKTEMFSGAELERLVKAAQLEAFRDGEKAVTQEHFEAALSDIEIDRDARKREVQRYIEAARALGCERRFLQRVQSLSSGEGRVKAFMEAGRFLS